MVVGHELTFLFTDIEGSTRLWSRSPVAMAAAVQRQEALLRDTVERGGGTVFKTVGDGIYAVFDRPDDAVRAAIAAQRALLAEPWSGFEEGAAIRVRIGVHTGPAEARDDDYFGPPLNRLSRTLAAGHGGQILCTDDTLAACAGMWPEGIEPRDLGERTLRDVPGSGRIFQLIAQGLPEHFPPLATLDPRVHNLPRWSSPSIGRETELARIRALVRSRSARLITVLGTGGVGKTRLVTEAAAPLLDEFQDGIRFVDLSAVRDDAQVIPAIVQATGAADQLLDPRDALLEWLHARTLLLVLDNCEQVIEGVAAICHAMLDAAPGVTILATSRVPIRIRGERQLSLEPLGVEGVLDAEQPAVRLFTERATEVSPDFTLDPEATEAVAEICRLVDGLPLAIELAAAWVRILSPDALRRRLQESRAILRDGARDLPDRQRALASTIAWSYELLDPDDQRAFRRLAVFRGGIAVDAAAAVIWEEPVSDPLWALTRLDALVQANLLQVTTDPTGEPRFTMLQTIQEFATGILHSSGEWDDASTAHAEFFAELASEARQHHGDEEVSHWFDRLDLDLQNLNAAIEFNASIPARKEAGLRLVLSLDTFLNHRGDALQERRWLELSYQDDAGYPPALCVDALLHIGDTWHSDPSIAGEYYRRAIQVAEATGEETLRMRSLASLSTVAALSGDYETALDMAYEVLEVGRRKSDVKLMGQAHQRIAYIACEAGMYDRALSACQQVRECAESNGDSTREAWSWVIEGRTHRRLRNPGAAVASLESAIARFEAVGDEEAIGLCRLEQGLAMLDEDICATRRLLISAAQLLVDTTDAYTIIAIIEGAARLLFLQHKPEQAMEFVGAVRRLREQTGIFPTLSDAGLLQEAIDSAVDPNATAAYDSQIERGRTYKPRAAIELFLAAAGS